MNNLVSSKPKQTKEFFFVIHPKVKDTNVIIKDSEIFLKALML